MYWSNGRKIIKIIFKMNIKLHINDRGQPILNNSNMFSLLYYWELVLNPCVILCCVYAPSFISRHTGDRRGK